MTLNLVTNQLGFQYPNGRKIDYPDLNIQQGSHWLIHGLSGSGKTTLLNIISGLLKPVTGSVQIGETDLYSLSSKKVDLFRGQHIGIVFQSPAFFSGFSVMENLLSANYFGNKNQDQERGAYLLRSLGIQDSPKKAIEEFSLGEQQRISIARALMNNPEILIADEPSSSLDDKNCFELIDLLEKEADEFGTSLIIVSHDARIKNRFSNQIELQ